MVRTSHVAKQSIKLQSVYIRNFYIKTQFSPIIILFISFIGEALKYVLPLPIPASIYGLVLMFVLLETKVLKVEAVQDAGKFLIEIMPMMFIPAGVGLLNAWDTLKPVLIVILFVSTIVVMGVSGKVTQTMIEAEERKKNEGHSE